MGIPAEYQRAEQILPCLANIKNSGQNESFLLNKYAKI